MTQSEEHKILFDILIPRLLKVAKEKYPIPNHYIVDKDKITTYINRYDFSYYETAKTSRLIKEIRNLLSGKEVKVFSIGWQQGMANSYLMLTTISPYDTLQLTRL